MAENKTIPILLIILGLIFILFPMFSITLVSIFVGFGVFLSGIILLIAGLQTRNQLPILSIICLIIGIVGLIFGLIFIFSYNAVSFITGIQFYILGFILLFLGLVSFLGDLEKITTSTGLILLVLGLVSLLLGAFAFNHPEILAIFIGLCIILQGVRMLILE